MLNRNLPRDRQSLAFWLLLPACLAICFANLLSFTGGLLRPTQPLLALAANPLDNQARLQAARPVGPANQGANGEAIDAMLARGVALSPGDARLLGALGLNHERQGDLATAHALYIKALRLSPTELQSLFGTLRQLIAARRFAEAADILDMVARRWSDRWPLAAPAARLVAADAAGRDRLTTIFAADRDPRRMLIEALAEETASLNPARQLLVDWHRNGETNLQMPVNLVTRRLIASKQAMAAFFLYRLTLTDAQIEESGYVNNGRFALAPSGNPFDWHLDRQAGIDFRQRPHLEGRKGGLAIRFLNNPVRLLNNVRQTTRIPPGAHQLRISHSQRDLRMPAPLRFVLRCLDSGATLADIALQTGHGEQVSSAGFDIPGTGCALQELRLVNRQMTESWRNRYSGTLLLHEVAVIRAGG